MNYPIATAVSVTVLLVSCAALGQRVDTEPQPPPAAAPALHAEQPNPVVVPGQQAMKQEHTMELGSLADWAVVIVTALGVGAAFVTLRELVKQGRTNQRSADAATQAALAAEQSVRLAASTYLDLKGHLVKTASDSSGRVVALQPSYRIANTSGNVARNVSIELRFGLNDRMNHGSVVPFTQPVLTPGKGFFLPVSLPLATPAEQQAYVDGTIRIRMQISATWTSPIGTESTSSFHRVLRPMKPAPRDRDWESVTLGGTEDARR